MDCGRFPTINSEKSEKSKNESNRFKKPKNESNCFEISKNESKCFGNGKNDSKRLAEKKGSECTNLYKYKNGKVKRHKLGRDVGHYNGAKVLFIDIETAPIKAAVWAMWKQNIGIDQIDTDWHMLSYSAKFMHDDTIYYGDQRNAKDIENDKPLLREVWSLLDEADIVIAHNGKKFDVPKIRTRFIINGFMPTRPFKQIDTLQVVQKNFGFSSNKLAYLSRILLTNEKEKHLKFPGYLLWKECLDRNMEAWDEMRTYNILDTIALEELYLKLRPWIPHHLNVGVYKDSDKLTCSCCGSEDIQLVGTIPTNVHVYPLYQCNECNGHSRGRKSLIESRGRAKNLLLSTM